LNQAFGGQPDQRLAHRRPRYAEPPDQRRLVESLARFQAERDDFLHQRAVRVLAAGAF
jgi:hypothetical protein